MKPGIPWSVKGIEEQARAAAKQAARQSGMTIGEWLNSVILESADGGDDLERRYRRPLYRPKPLHGSEHGEGEEVPLRLEEIAEQLHTIARHESDTAITRQTSPEDQAALRAIVERLDAYEQHTSTALDAMQERLEEVSERLARQPEHNATEHNLPERAEDVPGYHALEGALRNIIEHIEVSETRTRDSLRSMQDRLAGMTDQTGSGYDGAQAVSQLEQRVAELARRMAGSDAPQSYPSEDVTRLQGEIDSLKQRFDDMKLEPASDGDAGALRLEVEQLAATVSQASGHALGDLGARLQHLEAEFKSRTSESDPDTQRQIAELGQRIAATEARLDHLATIEHSVAQLARSLETGGSAAAAAAGGGHAAGASPELKALEDGLKAVRASAELADRRTQETLEAVHDTLEQIVAKLAELEAGDGSDGDGPDGEEAGEETDEEADEEADEVPDEELAGNFAANLAEEPAVSSAVAPEAEDLAMAPLGEADDMTATVPDGEGFVFPQDPPLEDSGSGLGEEPRTETSDGPMSGPYLPSETADAPVREDYIAAARRAAQMAATRNRNPVTSGFNRFSQAMSGARAQPGKPGNGSAPSRGVASSLFSGSWGRKGKSGEEPQRADKKSRRNRLIVAGLVLLAAASAYGAYRHAGSVPGIDMLGRALSGREAGPAKVDTPPAPQTRRDTAPAAAATRRSFSSEAGERTGTRPHEALTTAAIAPPGAATESARPRTALAETLPSEIGPLSLRQAAIGGDAIAQFVVANRYLEGKAVARDEGQAAQWLSQAARQGLTVAQYRLGSMYEHGRGMPLDRNEARVWYEKAAARGNITAMHNLAVLYTEPSTGQRYYELAANWFRRAAERGLKDSQYNLAVMSQQGLGVAQSPEDAVLWYSLAAAQGDQEAAAKAKALESSLASEAASRVHARLAAWRPLPIDREANMVPAGDPAWQEASAQAVADRKTN